MSYSIEKILGSYSMESEEIDNEIDSDEYSDEYSKEIYDEGDCESIELYQNGLFDFGIESQEDSEPKEEEDNYDENNEESESIESYSNGLFDFGYEKFDEQLESSVIRNRIGNRIENNKSTDVEFQNELEEENENSKESDIEDDDNIEDMNTCSSEAIMYEMFSFNDNNASMEDYYNIEEYSEEKIDKEYNKRRFKSGVKNFGRHLVTTGTGAYVGSIAGGAVAGPIGSIAGAQIGGSIGAIAADNWYRNSKDYVKDHDNEMKHINNLRKEMKDKNSKKESKENEYEENEFDSSDNNVESPERLDYFDPSLATESYLKTIFKLSIEDLKNEANKIIEESENIIISDDEIGSIHPCEECDDGVEIIQPDIEAEIKREAAETVEIPTSIIGDIYQDRTDIIPMEPVDDAGTEGLFNF